MSGKYLEKEIDLEMKMGIPKELLNENKIVCKKGNSADLEIHKILEEELLDRVIDKKLDNTAELENGLVKIPSKLFYDYPYLVILKDYTLGLPVKEDSIKRI